MQILEKATKRCPVCSEINHVELGQVEFICSRCGYAEKKEEKIVLN